MRGSFLFVWVSPSAPYLLTFLLYRYFWPIGAFMRIEGLRSCPKESLKSLLMYSGILTSDLNEWTVFLPPTPPLSPPSCLSLFLPRRKDWGEDNHFSLSTWIVFSVDLRARVVVHPETGDSGGHQARPAWLALCHSSDVWPRAGHLPSWASVASSVKWGSWTRCVLPVWNPSDLAYLAAGSDFLLPFALLFEGALYLFPCHSNEIRLDILLLFSYGQEVT